MPSRITKKLSKTLRGRNALLNIFELWVALAGIITGFVFLYDPSSIDGNALSKTIGYGLSAVWNCTYFFSGILIMWGLLRPSPKWEVAGLSLLGGATAVNAVAIVSVFGMRGVATSTTLFSLTASAWLRALFVYQTAIRLAEEDKGVTG